MKKNILAALFAIVFLLPTATFAAFDTSLNYGAQGSSVIELQTFLKNQHIYDGPITGRFLSLTQKAVKAFQIRESISPMSGFFGPLTRARAKALTMPVETTKAVDTNTDTTTTISQQTYVPPIQGCVEGSTFNIINGSLCTNNVKVYSNLPYGCTDTTGFSAITGSRCDGTPTPPATAVTPEQLTFTQKPKLVFKDDGRGHSDLVYMTWETNRPSRIVLAPTRPTTFGSGGIESGYWKGYGQPPVVTTDEFGWSTRDMLASCGRTSIIRTINTTCKVIVEDANGIIAETNIQVFDDFIDL